jgi:uncharacterized protein
MRVRTARLIREADGATLIREVELLTSLGQRLRGLLGRGSLPPGCAVWLAPCGSVHTFGMRFDLDLVFLDADRRIVRIARGVRRRRIVGGGSRARSVIEAQAGWLPADFAKAGDRVRLAE